MSENEKDTKSLAAVLHIKDEGKGEVEAVFATLGVKDKDDDIIAEGAIASGSKVKMSSYGHDAMFGAVPVGKGTVNVDGDKAVFKGNLFMSTQRGKETFEVLKEFGQDQEWSFGFRVLAAEAPTEEQRQQGVFRVLTKLDVFEVSPVMRGAGVGTHTLAVKEQGSDPTKDQAEADAKVASEAAAKAEFDKFLLTRSRLEGILT